jgi:hypothetical protein
MRIEVPLVAAAAVAFCLTAPHPEPPGAPDVPCGFALHQARSSLGTPELEAAADVAFARIEEKTSGLAVKEALALLDTFPAAFRSTRAAMRIEWLRLRIEQRGR